MYQRKEKKILCSETLFRTKKDPRELYLLIEKMQLSDKDYFFYCVRMSSVVLDERLLMIALHRTKTEIQLRRSISP